MIGLDKTSIAKESMSLKRDILQTEEFVSIDRLMDAIELLKNCTKKYDMEIYYEVITVSGELHALQKAVIIGRINFAEECHAKRQLTFRILILLRKIKRQFFQQEAPF